MSAPTSEDRETVLAAGCCLIVLGGIALIWLIFEAFGPVPGIMALSMSIIFAGMALVLGSLQ